MELNRKKNTVKEGDIFEVKLKNKKKYFQFVLRNLDYMGGYLIRSFNYKCLLDYKPQIDEIVNSGVTAYTYTWVKNGVKQGLWEKIGNRQIEQNFEMPYFRQTNDNFQLVKKSYSWFIWKGNISNRIPIGELTDEYKDLPLSDVHSINGIIKWIEIGDKAFEGPL